MPEERQPEQHIWLKKYNNLWICAFCHSETNKGPLEAEIGLCPAAINRMLIHDVGEEIQEADRDSVYRTQEVNTKRDLYTQYARDLVADAGFAGEIVKSSFGDRADSYKGPILAEIFKEIRAERRRNKPVEGLMRLEHGVLLEIEPPE